MSFHEKERLQHAGCMDTKCSFGQMMESHPSGENWKRGLSIIISALAFHELHQGGGLWAVRSQAPPPGGSVSAWVFRVLSDLASQCQLGTPPSDFSPWPDISKIKIQPSLKSVSLEQTWIGWVTENSLCVLSTAWDKVCFCWNSPSPTFYCEKLQIHSLNSFTLNIYLVLTLTLICFNI